jgi:enoyl-CoA hydratase/carnithine racemase
MATINVSMQGATAVLRLDNGTTNAISSELVADLAAALAQVRVSAGGLVLAGNSKFFSIGLNLPELIEFDRAAMIAFFTHFDQLSFDLYTLPLPTACAMTGHAVAGGGVLALTCDFRFAAAGNKLFGFNEATIGLPVPYLPDLVLRQLVGDRAATEMLYHGRFLPGDRAAEIGLVDTVLPLAEVEEQAVATINTLAAQPRKAFALIKESRTDAVRTTYELHNRAKLNRMLDCWFDDSVQALLRTAADKF